MNRYGLIGEKLSHSFSKEIHEQLADYKYDLIELEKNQLDEFFRKKEFNAINVTIPYKQDVIKYLDTVDSKAKAINAVNTIVNINGKLVGYNTDYYGFKYMCEKHGINFNNKKVLVIGDGGASKAIQAVVNDYKIKDLIIVDIEKKESTITYDELDKHLDVEIVINTSPVGMYPNIDNSPIDLIKFEQVVAVVDVIYNPLNTKLCVDARKLNITNVTGLEMLIGQAKYAVEYFLDKSIDNKEIDIIYKRMLKDTYNIVLIGMPSCGKTFVSRRLHEISNRQIVDIDEQIVEKAGKPIPEIFEELKEVGFRFLETQVIKEVSKKNNMIIATGGGCIKNEINIDYLRMNSRIYFLDRSLDLLICDDPNRPLSKSKEAVKTLYEERHDLYKKYADKIIDSNQDIDKVALDILEDYNETFNS